MMRGADGEQFISALAQATDEIVPGLPEPGRSVPHPAPTGMAETRSATHDRLGIESIGAHARPPGAPPSRQWGPNWRP